MADTTTTTPTTDTAATTATTTTDSSATTTTTGTDAANSTTSTTDDSKPAVNIKDQAPSDFKPVFANILDKSENLDRRADKGIVNSKTGSSVVVRDDGQINLSASVSAQFKLNPNGKTEETSLESITKTNRKNFQIDDFMINNHKMNPQLWEMADMRQLYGDPKYAGGGLCMLGTMMVRAWDTELKRYVLIRRLVNMPMFYQTANTPQIPDGLNVADSTVVANTYDTTASESTNTNSTTADSGIEAIKAAANANNTKNDKKNPISDALNKAKDTVGDTAKTAVTDATKSVTDAAKNAAQDATKSVADATKDATKDVAKDATAAAKGQATTDASGDATDAIKKATQGIGKDGGSAIVNALKNAGSKAVAQVKGEAKKKVTDAEKKAADVKSKATKSKAQEIIDKNIVSKKEDIKKDIAKKIEDAGKDAVSGMFKSLGKNSDADAAKKSLDEDRDAAAKALEDDKKKRKDAADKAAADKKANDAKAADDKTKKAANPVIDNIKKSSGYLSDKIDLGLTAVDSQLTAMKNDLVEKTKKENEGKSKEEVKGACKLVLMAADNAFDSSKVELLETASNIQKQSEVYIHDYIGSAAETTAGFANDMSSKAVYDSVYKEVKKELATSSTNIKKAVSGKDALDVIRGKESLGTVTQKVKSAIVLNANTVFQKTVMKKINEDILKEKQILTTLENKLKAYEQEEIKKLQAIVKGEVDKIMKVVTDQISAGVNDIVENLSKKHKKDDSSKGGDAK